MKKRLISTILVFVLVVSISSISASAATGLANFTKVNSYTNGQFTDVKSTDWFASNVASAYEYGLMTGSGANYFNASGNLTIAEAIALACRIHSTYYTNGANFVKGELWYQVYVDYALQNGIISNAYSDYLRPASRSEMVVILGNALPKSEFTEMNNIDNGAIPDVSQSASYSDVVYLFYRAGILVGNDSSGRFAPADKIGRNAVAAIVTRIVNPSLRKTFKLVPSSDASTLTADDIYAKCAPAVFLISTYDVEGYAYATGSGFFIDSTGTAITNYHVIENAFTMKIGTTDGKTYSDVKVIAFSIEHDVAILKVSGSHFNYLSVGDSSKIKGGEAVYAIGNPLGLTSSITDGLISNIRREDYDNRIQISVPISQGNSGGALINGKGEVIGITQSSLINGQNLNFAVPINMAMSLPRVSPLSLSEVARLAAIEEYKNIPTAFKNNYNEIEPNDSWEQALLIDNGMSIWGVIDDDLMDVYMLRCNTTGTIKVYLFSKSQNIFVDDILLIVESSDGSTSPESKTVTNDDGSHMLFLSYAIPKAGYYSIDLLSKTLYKYYSLNTDYEFYYEFIPS